MSALIALSAAVLAATAICGVYLISCGGIFARRRRRHGEAFAAWLDRHLEDEQRYWQEYDERNATMESP